MAFQAGGEAEDACLLGMIEAKALNGVRLRFLLGNPDSPSVALRGKEAGIGDAMAAKIRNALTHYRLLIRMDNVEIRLHDAVLYNSIYRADNQVLVNQHAYGVRAAHSPVYCFRRSASSNMTTAYPDSFERVWDMTMRSQNAGCKRPFN